MKELEKIDQDNTAVVDQINKIRTLFDKQRRIPGLTLWEFNNVTGVLEKAKFKPLAIMITGSPKGSETMSTYEVDMNDNCVYFQALNRKNAVRKLNKYGVNVAS